MAASPRFTAGSGVAAGSAVSGGSAGGAGVLKAGSAIAAFGLCLCSAAPSAARDRTIAGIAPNPVFSGMARGAERASPAVGRQGAPVQFSNDSILVGDGAPGAPHAIVGSLPLVGPVAAEVGLFSVNGASVKEREFKRTDPMADVQPRRSRVAAIGLRMLF
ncbi:MAG TPA: hypothetical protein VEZ70_11180 [Allosphingosinicella sp.]|nr:hypothetical protein [Allosphingosinicella sp.]